ncbi:MAG: PSD1 and planctomycete cytochrome C domain-containing protein [Planctomycetota bacterium]|nr:PSD1 and planctomycete cytochrome C domain-containing protein [Planctomycetota bacterium]
MMAVVRILSVSVLAVGLLRGQCLADDYLKLVKVLKARCYACHGALKQESDLRLDTVASIRKGAADPIVNVEKPELSELLQRVMSNDDSVRMPPEGEPLKPAEIEALRDWIAAGAPSPEHEEADSDPREHWAFRRPVKVDLPALGDESITNPIDAFITAKHRKLGLTPVEPVQKSLLLRRVYLDLIGLPPTRDELRAFLADAQPGAWDRVVDRLLESPQYGERWGRHWMDVWRYTDWYGLGAQLRNSQKHMWHWRDWIIESLNDDKGYDRMVLEMLAADELAPTDPQTLRATGFLARNYYLFNRTTWLDSTIEHTSKAFFGLTMNCAKCHDHKFDPLSHVDYYSMRAIFEPHQVRLDSLPGQIDLEQDGLPRVFDAHLDTPTYLHLRGNEKDPDTSRVMPPDVPALLSTADFLAEPVSLSVEAHTPRLRVFVLGDHLAAAEREIETARKAVAASQAAAEAASVASDDSTPTKESPGQLFLLDEFNAANSEEWENGSGEWVYADGKVTQKQVGATRRYLRTRKDHPTDFEATLKFRTLGGERWKSVGLAFDSIDGREKMVYMSAVQPGSKLQIAINSGSGSQYPADGFVTQSVSLDTGYELKIAVRGDLINIAIDGLHTLAYRLKVKREVGRLDLVAFDAVAEFDSVEIRELPSERRLSQPGVDGSTNTEQIVQQLASDKAGLAAAELRPVMIRTAFAADQARQNSPDDERTTALIVEAATAARKYEVAVAELAIARSLLELAGKLDAAKKKAAEERLTKEHASLVKAKEAVAKPGTSYTSIRASEKALEGPSEKEDSRRAPYPESSTGRRTAFARWIIDPRNPLPSRVAVNHVWLRHFGQPLVDPVDDFGRRTKAPPMQELLDWLAVDFQEKGWSMKRLHRLMVTSQTYQRATGIREADAATLKTDPTNQFYWRRVPVRMESQMIRDSVLHLAGVLDLKMGGRTENPKDVNVRRRSMYFTQSRDDHNPFVAMFDDADIQNCYRRSESIVPQQALAMANSRLTLEMSRKLRDRIAAQLEMESAGESPSVSNADEAFVGKAFELLIARQPVASELMECQSTLIQLAEALQGKPDAAARAQAALVHALLNHNDFVTIR